MTAGGFVGERPSASCIHRRKRIERRAGEQHEHRTSGVSERPEVAPSEAARIATQGARGALTQP